MTGTVFPVSAYLKSAMMDYQSVKTSHIEDLAVNTAKIAKLAVKSGNIDDLAVTTLKIQDNAVTVPVAVSTNTSIVRSDSQQYNPTVFGSSELAKLVDTGNFFGDVLTLTLNRSGGPCRVEGSISIFNLSGSTWNSNGNTITGVADRIYVGVVIYKNGTAVHFAKVPMITNYIDNIAIFNGHATIPLYVDPAMTGACTFKIKVGLATPVSGGGVMLVRAYGGKGGAMVEGASLAVLELKK